MLCKTSIRAFLSADTLEEYDSEYVQKYAELRTQKKIRIQGIINRSAASEGYKEHSKELMRDVRLVPQEKMDIVPEVYVYDNTVAIFSIKERLGVSIESKDIAYAFRKLYDLAWEKAGEYEGERD